MNALKTIRFTHFELHIDNGKTILVSHPECLVFNQPKTTAVIVDGERFQITDLNHISALSYKRKARLGKVSAS